MPVERKRTPSCFTLSPVAIAALTDIAVLHGGNRSQTVEQLILSAHAALDQADARQQTRFTDNKLGRMFADASA